MTLTNKVALITGGNGFLGQHFVSALKNAGATVVVTGHDNTADISLDVTGRESITKAFEQVMQKHGKIDVVINNAAIDPKFDARAEHKAIRKLSGRTYQTKPGCESAWIYISSSRGSKAHAAARKRKHY